MKTFKDNEGQTWTLSLTLPKARSLREKLGLDIFNSNDHIQILASLLDQLSFCYLLCEDQAKSLGVSIEDFEKRLYGDRFAREASRAFLSEMADFFHRLGKDAEAKLTERSIEVADKASKELDRMLSTGELDSVLDKAATEMEEALLPNVGSG